MRICIKGDDIRTHTRHRLYVHKFRQTYELTDTWRHKETDRHMDRWIATGTVIDTTFKQVKLYRHRPTLNHTDRHNI